MTSARLDINNQDLVAGFSKLAQDILSLDSIDAVLVPVQQPGAMVMPTLISKPGLLAGIDPLSPCFALNAAKTVCQLTRKPSGHRLAVLLRPCEIRAFIELIKLNQGSRDDIVIIGHDCLGAMTNAQYLAFNAENPGRSTPTHYQGMLQNPLEGDGLKSLAPACQACETPFADAADLSVWLFGVDTSREMLIQAKTDKGKSLLDDLGYGAADTPPGRTELVQSIVAQRTGFRDAMIAHTQAATDTPQKLSAYLGACVNCYNCRVACPVCYCRECVFVTDVFQHEPFQYFNWSQRKGAVKLPADTVFYHLTRMAHMSTACVGCGQCTNACPNDIPLMELFRSVALFTQAAFDYRPGEDVNQKPPLTEFKESEFESIVGLG